MRGVDVTLAADHGEPTIRTLFCGFGPASRYAAARLLRAGQPASSIRILATGGEESDAAALLGLDAPSWRSGDLGALELDLFASITRIIVDLAEETVLEPVVRHARAKCPGAQVVVVLASGERAETVLASGASKIVNPAAIAGSLLAFAAIGPGRAEEDPCH